MYVGRLPENAIFEEQFGAILESSGAEVERYRKQCTGTPHRSRRWRVFSITSQPMRGARSNEGQFAFLANIRVIGFDDRNASPSLTRSLPPVRFKTTIWFRCTCCRFGRPSTPRDNENFFPHLEHARFTWYFFIIVWAIWKTATR